jgi:hypothetical protein
MCRRMRRLMREERSLDALEGKFRQELLLRARHGLQCLQIRALSLLAHARLHLWRMLVGL